MDEIKAVEQGKATPPMGADSAIQAHKSPLDSLKKTGHPNRIKRDIQKIAENDPLALCERFPHGEHPNSIRTRWKKGSSPNPFGMKGDPNKPKKAWNDLSFWLGEVQTHMRYMDHKEKVRIGLKVAELLLNKVQDDPTRRGDAESQATSDFEALQALMGEKVNAQDVQTAGRDADDKGDNAGGVGERGAGLPPQTPAEGS